MTRPIIESISVPIVVGSGISGLATALLLSRVAVVTKGPLASGSSDYAQGGIAAAIDNSDRVRAHAANTIAVGGGLVDEAIARLVTDEGPDRISWLQTVGARFDRDTSGAIELSREAGHSADRIVHAHGDATGREVMRALRSAVVNRPSIALMEYTTVVDLVRDGGRIVGVVAMTAAGDRLVLLAPAVVLATGGIGQVYAKTTNPPEVTGDGLAVAARAGAVLGDLEFVQFHPTALDADTDPLPLLTEALRGAGAILVDEAGRRFMTEIHPDAELAPRDVVARAVGRAAGMGGAYLDAMAIDGDLADRFPTLVATAAVAGIDPRSELLPVTPAAHYHMGGVVIDAAGRTSLPGLYACGEVAASGLHGANRLAGNSLLEGLVFADRVATAIQHTDAAVPDRTEIPVGCTRLSSEQSSATGLLREAMWQSAGVVRNDVGLSDLVRTIEDVAPTLDGSAEARNLVTVARLVATAARSRTESRGSHYRSDYPLEATGRRSTTRPLPVATRVTAAEPAPRVSVA